MTNLIKVFLLYVLVVSPAYSFEYNFVKGWNLFSPVITEPVSAQVWLGESGLNILPDVVRVWGFGGNGSNGWSSFVPGNATFMLEPGMGYWFYMRNQRTVSLSDTHTEFSMTINGSGWRLVGTNSSVAVALTEAGLFNPLYTSNAAESVRRIWAFANNTWTSYSPNQTSGLSSLTPGYGYWFYLHDGLNVDTMPDLSSLLPPTCPGCPSVSN